MTNLENIFKKGHSSIQTKRYILSDDFGFYLYLNSRFVQENESAIKRLEFIRLESVFTRAHKNGLYGSEGSNIWFYTTLT